MIAVEILRKVENFRPLWPGLTRILSQLASREPDDKVVRTAIQGDPILTALTLRYANSAASSPSAVISDIQVALARMGMMRVLQYLAANGLRNSLGTAIPQYGYDEKGLWRHSMMVAVAARCAALQLQKGNPGVAYTAGLLHDLGKIAMAMIFPDEIGRLARAAESGQQYPMHQAEIDAFGFSHAELGYELARKWNLPEEICAAIASHHGTPCQNPDWQDTCDFVLIGDVVSHILGEGLGEAGTLVARDTGMEVRLGINRQWTEVLCANSLVEFQETMKAYQ